MSSNIVNWENVFNHSESFKQNTPFKFAFIENFFQEDFYKKLYDTYPSLDSFVNNSNMTKTQLIRFWGKCSKDDNVVIDEQDPNYSDAWNEFKHYAHSSEFIENFRKFSGVPVDKLKQFNFMAYGKGGFQLPHIHDVGPSTLIMLFYFSAGWEKGDPGGTYLATEADESKIIFEPYNLNNSVALFHDSPNSAHGVRYITKNVERRGVQIVLEGYSDESGWTGKIN